MIRMLRISLPVSFIQTLVEICSNEDTGMLCDTWEGDITVISQSDIAATFTEMKFKESKIKGRTRAREISGRSRFTVSVENQSAFRSNLSEKNVTLCLPLSDLDLQAGDSISDFVTEIRIQSVKQNFEKEEEAIPALQSGSVTQSLQAKEKSVEIVGQENDPYKSVLGSLQTTTSNGKQNTNYGHLFVSEISSKSKGINNTALFLHGFPDLGKDSVEDTSSVIYDSPTCGSPPAQNDLKEVQDALSSEGARDPVKMTVHSGETLTLCVRTKRQRNEANSSTGQSHGSRKLSSQPPAHLCPDCPAVFKRQSSLLCHRKEIHLGLKDKKCDVCFKVFSRQSQLNRHMNIHAPEDKKYSCSICGSKFSIRSNLTRHVQTLHRPLEECFHCSYCGKGFTQKATLLSHIQYVHFPAQNFSCSVCGKYFSQNAGLTSHMNKIHGTVDLQFARSEGKVSKYLKTAEDMFYCSACKAGFYFRAQLLEHMYTDHADDFPFKCNECSQGFLQEAFLIVHTQNAHGMQHGSTTQTIP